MTAVESSVANWFETELSTAVGASDLTFNVGSIGSLTSPALIIVNPGSATKREVIRADGTWGPSSFVASDISRRGLAGSAGGAQAHDAGTKVVVAPLAQHIEDIYDLIKAHAAATDPHAQYLTTAEGNDAYVGVAGDTMTGPLLLPDGTAAAPGVGFSSDAGGTGFIRTGLGSIGTTLNGTQHYAHQASRFIPIPDNTLTLGGSGFRWSQLWAGTTTINTSDETQKNTVVDTPLGLDFVKAVRPIDFVYNGRRRTHVGFSAQQVSEALAAVGAGDRAIYVDPAVGAAEREAAGPPAKQKDESTEDHAERVEQWRDEVARDKAAPKGLRYSELIAPLYRAVQEQQAIIEQQAATIADLVSRVEALEASK